jgi:glycosyltransferase involved in cell wall biosynthesis
MSFRFAHHVITINEPIQDLLVGRGLSRGKSTVIMNAVDEASFIVPIRSVRTDNVTATSGRFVMMYHGTITRIYGLEVAIEAFAMAHTDMPTAEFWILGDGPERKALERLAEERGVATKVKLFGTVPLSAIPDWLVKCDVGILPMRRDVFLEFAFPNKLSEYIVSGKSVVVPRLRAIRHYFSENSLAYFEPGDVSDLASQMVRVYRDSSERARLAANARSEYGPISWGVMRERYCALMEAMAGPAYHGSSPSDADAALRR